MYATSSENKRGGPSCKRRTNKIHHHHHQSNSSKTLDRKSVVSSQPTLDAGIKKGTLSSKSGRFKDEQGWGKKCFEDLDQRRMGRPLMRTWSTDFLLREGSSREGIGKWMTNKAIPWRRHRRLLQVVTGTFPCGLQMMKYGYKRTETCTLCQKTHTESGSSWTDELPKETISNIQNAGCLGQKEVVTASHNVCIRELLLAKSVCMGKQTGTSSDYWTVYKKFPM